MIRFLQTQGTFQKVLLIGVLAFISVMMVMYLVPGFLDAFGNTASNPDIVAKVGSKEITVQDVQRTAAGMARQQFPRGAPPQILPYFQQQAADKLIYQNVFLEEAHRLGLDATNAELVNELQHGPLSEQLYPEGKFIGTEQYTGMIQNAYQMPVGKFEDLVKQSITTQKLQAVIQGGATVSDSDMKSAYMQKNTKVKVDYAFFSIDALSKTITPSDAELNAYYQKMQPQMANAIPEQRKARYIVVTAGNTGVRVTDADLQKYYNQHKEEYRVQKSATVRHILISTGPADSKPDQKTVDAAKAKAQDVLKQLKGGAKFADLAKKYSEDPGSKDKGGELGTIAPGQTVPTFESAVFGANKGDLVGPVQSPFGFHIIQVEDKTEAHLKTLDEVRSQIQPLVERDNARVATEQLARTIETQARTQGLDKAAAEHNLPVTTTDYFDRGTSLPGIGNSAPFGDYIFTNKPMSPPTAIQTQTAWVIAQATESKPARTPTFEEAKSRLAQSFGRERAQALLAQKTQELADKAHALHNLKDAAKQLNATFKSSDLVAPSQQIPDLGMLGNLVDVNAMKVGDISGPLNAGQNGAVVSLVDKQVPTDAEFAKNKDSVREQLLGDKRNQVLEVYVTQLRAKMEKSGKIKIFQKNLDRLTASDTSNQ